MQIFVKMLTGKTIAVETEFFDTVLQVKAVIHKRESISPDKQSLFFANKLLEDSCALAGYFIVNESTLDLFLHSCYYPQYIQIKAAELVASDNFNEKMEQKFFSLYDKILNYRFPPSEGVDVCPQWLVSDSRRLDDFTTSFAIELNQHPLLLVEIKPSSDFQYDSGCNGAILQVLNCLDEIGPKNLHADRLYAISAIGKRWRACFSLKGNSSQGGQPVMGVTKKLSLSSAHPECWNPDITSDASYIAFQGIVDTIKSYIAQ